MASLKDLRNRIASVKATQKITKAMQMVAAAKLRRAQPAAEAARPYAERMEKVLADVSRPASAGTRAARCSRGTGGDAGASARRLHGGARPLRRLQFLDRPARARQGGRSASARARRSRSSASAARATIFCKRQFGAQIIEVIELRGVRQLGFGNADEIGRKIIALFEKGEFDVATLFFSRFRSVIAQIPTRAAAHPGRAFAAAPSARACRIYDYEPEPNELLAELLPRNISVQVFRALLENAASEQGARMSAMDNATRNAGDMIKKQTLNYNRTRQAMITKELIEIISGAEAL